MAKESKHRTARPSPGKTDTHFIPADWTFVSLGSLLARDGGSLKTGPFGTLLNGSEYSDEGVPLLSVREIGYGTINIHAKTPMVPSEVVRRLPEYTLHVGDIVFGRKGAVDRVGLVKHEQDGWFLGSDGIRLRLPATVDPRYVSLQLQRDVVRKWLQANAIGTTMASLNQEVLRRVQFPLAPVPEQRAIAAALSDVDALIEALDAAVAKKRAIKLAAMQQLLTGKTRLPGFLGDWFCCKLADIGQFSKGRGIKRDDVTDHGLACIRYGELYTRYENYVLSPASRIPPEVALSALPIRYGDLLFAGSGETAEEIGKCVAYLGEEVAYAGGDIVVLTPSEQNPIYLGHLMNHREVAQQKARYGQGDAVVHISARNLALVDVTLPSKDEQDAIACVLLDMDAEIAVLEQRREKTKAIKQGMMQALLTGRVRLVEPEAV